MPENDYTGTPIEDDETSVLEDLGLFEFDLDEEALAVTTPGEDDEVLLHIGAAADGAKSLRDAAERLYDCADELLELSGDGWEIVDDITGGYGTAVRFGADDTDELETDNG